MVVLHREFDVLLEDKHLITRVLIQADFADAEDRLGLHKFGDEREHVVGQLHILGLLRVDAKPAIMREAVLGRALRLVLRELAEVIIETVRCLAVEARPEGRFADGRATRQGHRLVVVGGAAHHVAVRFDITHGRGLLEARPNAGGGLGVSFFDRGDGGVAPEVENLGDAVIAGLQ